MQPPHPCMALVETVFSHLTPTTHFIEASLNGFQGGREALEWLFGSESGPITETTDTWLTYGQYGFPSSVRAPIPKCSETR
jgi:hypothetical protein